jgi:ribulose-5-phosphate 4-epimerase/fuculose-1-phosphate aldolase
LLATHISARLPDRPGFFINPYGMLFREITASSLVEIDLDGNKVSASPYEVNPAGFTIHSAIHQSQADAHCVIHLHTTAGVAISLLECGLLPLSQTAATIAHDIGYHDYEGFAVNLAERESLARDISGKRILILRNHGTLVVGATVAEAFIRATFLERACEIQLRAMSTGQALRSMPPAAAAFTARAADSERVVHSRRNHAWPALMRMLDEIDASYKE